MKTINQDQETISIKLAIFIVCLPIAVSGFICGWMRWHDVDVPTALPLSILAFSYAMVATGYVLLGIKKRGDIPLGYLIAAIVIFPTVVSSVFYWMLLLSPGISIGMPQYLSIVGGCFSLTAILVSVYSFFRF